MASTLKQTTIYMNDKLKHLIGGFIFGSITNITGYDLGGFIISSIAFFGKENFDVNKPYPTGFDWLDIRADYNGFFIGYGAVAMIRNIFSI